MMGKLVTHGGSGSGDFEHSGRPGKIGGSSKLQTPKEINKAIRNWEKTLSPIELDGVKLWREQFNLISKYELTGKDEIFKDFDGKEKKISELSRGFDRALRKGPIYHGPIFRGMALLNDRVIKHYTTLGNKIYVSSSQSFTVDEDYADNFTDSGMASEFLNLKGLEVPDSGTFIVLRVKDNRSGVITEGNKYNPFEVVPKKGTTYRITKVTPKFYELNDGGKEKGFLVDMKEDR